MRNIWRIFRDDARRLVANTMSVVITVGLVVLPSLFAWYNVLACWDVFDNTGNLKVAVANSDAGYESDLFPLPVNVGDQVVSALRANDQIDWVFTDEEDAVDGARAGRYYAAVVIPESFSRDMLTFYADDAQCAEIVYYSNEKKNAIAPKVTDQGADTISYQVNETFAETLSETALAIAESVSRYAGSSDASGALSAIAGRMGDAADRLDEVAALLETYGALAESSQGLVDQSSQLISSARDQLAVATATAGEGAAAAGGAADGLVDKIDGLLASLSNAEQGFDDLANRLEALDIGGAVDGSGTPSEDGGGSADGATTQPAVSDADDAETPGTGGDAGSGDSGEDAPALPGESDSESPDEGASGGGGASEPEGGEGGAGISGAIDALRQLRDDAVVRAREAASDIGELRSGVEADVRAPVADFAAGAVDFEGRVAHLSAELDAAGSRVSGAAESARGALADAQSGISGAAADVRESAERLRSLSSGIDEALSEGDSAQLQAVLSADVQTLSKAIAAPVAVDRVAVYPVDNFGSAMTPLYAALALFIGSLLLMVAMKPAVPDSEVARLDDPKPRELFLGRFCVIGAMSLLQTTVMGLGCMLFLQVQVAHPLLFMVCFWASGLVFSFVIYALVAAFANLGKAIAVLLLIVQVTGCGGSYPLAILPGFVQAVSPYLPATHVVNAMRAAMMGVYGNDFWASIGLLLLFLVPAAVVGLVLRRPFARFMHWFVEHAESSKLIG